MSRSRTPNAILMISVNIFILYCTVCFYFPSGYFLVGCHAAFAVWCLGYTKIPGMRFQFYDSGILTASAAGSTAQNGSAF